MLLATHLLYVGLLVRKESCFEEKHQGGIVVRNCVPNMGRRFNSIISKIIPVQCKFDSTKTSPARLCECVCISVCVWVCVFLCVCVYLCVYNLQTRLCIAHSVAITAHGLKTVDCRSRHGTVGSRRRL